MAALAHVLVAPDSTIPVVGAPGAIAAVMGAYLCGFPDAPVRTLIFFFLILFVDIRARWLLIGWFIMQFFTSPDSGVAWVAHVGGFAFGVLVALAIRASGGLRTRPSAGPIAQRRVGHHGRHRPGSVRSLSRQLLIDQPVTRHVARVLTLVLHALVERPERALVSSGAISSKTSVTSGWPSSTSPGRSPTGCAPRRRRRGRRGSRARRRPAAVR